MCVYVCVCLCVCVCVCVIKHISQQQEINNGVINKQITVTTDIIITGTWW